MKYLILFTISAVAFVSCLKDNVTYPSPMVPGGKGGKYNIAVFPTAGQKGISGMVYIKYGTVDKPSSMSSYSDSSATMVEPGFGPHAHFFSLKAGYYAIKAIGLNNGQEVQGDTLIEIRDTQANSVDFKLHMH